MLPEAASKWRWCGSTGPGQAQGDVPCANTAAPARLGPRDRHPVSTVIAYRKRVTSAGVGEDVHEQYAAAVGCHPCEQDFDEIGIMCYVLFTLATCQDFLGAALGWNYVGCARSALVPLVHDLRWRRGRDT